MRNTHDRYCRREIRVGSTHRVRFTGGATRWLGIWLDAALNLEENRRRRLGKTRQAEARLRRIVSQYGMPPASTRNLQAPIVQGTMLYASELIWNGQSKVEKFMRGCTRLIALHKEINRGSGVVGVAVVFKRVEVVE